MSSINSEPDWAYLPALTLSLILDKLLERLDHVWFSAVCKNWCSVAKLNHQSREFRSKVLPMLMIPTKRKSRTKRSLYGIATDKVYHFQLPVPYGRRCCGSSHGWLATVDPNFVITLLNPFKNVTPIRLPPLKRGDSYLFLHERNILKVTLSADPTTSPDDYVVAAIHSVCCHLAFIKAGQKYWTYIDKRMICFTDITCYKGLVYAVGRWGTIVSFDLCDSTDPSGCEKKIPNILALENIGGGAYSERAYLVKSLEGDLWMVRRFLDHHDDEDAYSRGTKSFKVYKLELDAQSGKLLQKVEVNSLGDNVLFVGDNDSMSVSASYFSNCLQKDSIYYTDDFIDECPLPYPSGPFDLGFYNVKDGSFGKHYPFNPSFKRMPPALWVLPPFQWD